MAADHWAHPYVEALAGSGITGGCSADPPLYCPGQPVTRAQMAVFILRAMGHADHLPSYQGYFDDVPAGLWFTGFVEHLSEHGITSGCSTSPPRYCPGSAVTRAQMAVFIVRAFGL